MGGMLIKKPRHQIIFKKFVFLYLTTSRLNLVSWLPVSRAASLLLSGFDKDQHLEIPAPRKRCLNVS